MSAGCQRMLLPQCQAGIDHRMHHDAARVRLVGVAQQLPAFTQRTCHLGQRGRVAHRACPAERTLDRGWSGGVALLRQQGGEQSVARRIAHAHVLRRRSAGSPPGRRTGWRRCPARATSARHPGPSSFAPAIGGAEHAAGGGDVPTARVMPGRDGVADPAFDLGAQDEGVQHRRAGQSALFRQRQCGRRDRRGGMDHRAQMRVVIVQQVAGDRIDEGGAERIQPLRAADQRDAVRSG